MKNSNQFAGDVADQRVQEKMLDTERVLILYIFPKQRTDEGSIPIRMPPVITPQTRV
jgi:hypothetical protein